MNSVVQSIVLVSMIQGSVFLGQGATSPSRIIGLDFNDGSTKSRFFPRTLDSSETSPGSTIGLQPEFVEGMERKGLRSRELKDGLILDLVKSGSTSFSTAMGTIRFWFRPDWNSGEGPGGYGSFFSLGKWNAPSGNMEGYWGMSVDPKGERIQLGAQSKEQGMTFTAAPLRFKKNNWYEITVSYSDKASWIYIDGIPHGPGHGISINPPKEALEKTGLAVGNTPWGYQPVKGVVDGFEYFNFPFGNPENSSKYYALSASVRKQPTSVYLQWGNRKHKRYTIKRRALNESDWTIIAQDFNQFDYLDTSEKLKPGAVYQYQVEPFHGPGVTNRVNVAVYAPPTHHRGKVLILVDETQRRSLEDDVKEFKRILELDGWSVAIAKAPRHSDRRWKTNVKRIAEVKEIIHSHHAALSDGLKMVFIIGHVAVPYSGYQALDGHGRPGDDHRGAWSCDAYYGDLDGVWRDQSVQHTGGTHWSNHNVPGDGKFDEDRMPTRLEVAVGRVDFANLPSISGKILPEKPRRKSQVETELIRQYLRKNIAYRKGELVYEPAALIHSSLSSGHRVRMFHQAIMNAASWYGHIPGKVRGGNGFFNEALITWAFMGGHSGSSSFASGMRRVRDFNRPEKAPRAAFMMFYSSWHGDWNLPDSFLRATLTTPNAGLASFSMLVGPWWLGDLGRGECLGYSYLQTANEQPIPGTRALAIMGDPTLRQYVTPAATELSMNLAGQTRQLTWKNPAIDNLAGVYVYLFNNKLDRFKMVAQLDASSEFWNVSDETPKDSRFMVRVGQWIHSASGSFVSLSQGTEYILP